MKYISYKLLTFCFFLFFVENTVAQTCSSTFTVKTISTASTCQANGTITVTLEGDLTNISNVQYGLSSTSGFTINPQENNVLTNIPAGSYTVTVRAFCAVDTDFNAVKTVSNVVVGGTYKVPTASFNANSSRKSYERCNSGIIALDVKDGSGNFTFDITTAPAGSPTGVVTPAKSGTLYTLPGSSYPAGNYVVQVNDGCYTTVATFTLGEVVGFPAFVYPTYQGFSPILTDGVCDKVKWHASITNINTNPDYLAYYNAGLYEVGAAPTGSMPTAWTEWKSSNFSNGYANNTYLTLDIAPYTYSNFYTSGSISIYTRLKNCPNVYTSIPAYFYNPTLSNSYTDRACDKFVYNITPYTSYGYSMLCYPASIVVTKVIGGEVVYNNPSWSYSSSGCPVSLDYNTNYKITFTDASGKVIAVTLTGSRSIVFSTDVLECDTYQLRYSAPAATSCWPINITITDPDGKVTCTDVIENSTAIRTSCPLEYGKTYIFKAVYPDGYEYTMTKKTASPFPTTVNLTRYNSNACYEDYGNFRVTLSSTPPIGTKFTITGPEGYTSQTYTTTSTLTSYNFAFTTMPAGEYTLTTDYGCGTPVKSTYTSKGVYSGKALSYTTENVCAGLKVTPSGLMTYEGSPTTTYYRLISGPTGYDKSVISPGESFVFSTSGRYIFGILNTNSSSGCVIKQDTINYTAVPLSLSQAGTSAYECTGSNKGIILLKAENGVAPYTYQLWNKSNTVKLVATDIISSDQIHFDYGRADSTYTVRVSDNCGNTFSQQVTLAKLTTARIVYADPVSVCIGETINLKCITLGNTAYNWTGPNGYKASGQNLEIPNAQANMTGWYKVTVLPEFCGSPVVDSTYVVVYSPLSAGAVSGVQAVCVRTVGEALGCSITGGSGAYTYQWQSSINGTSNWTNISGATSATYLPPSHIQSQVNYYRVVVTDRCGTVNSNVITVNYKPCYLPVNPHVRSRAGG